MLNSWIYLWVAIASVIITYGCCHILNRHQLFDIPNERSSHTVPVVRGGGVAFTLLYLVVLLVIMINGDIARADLLVLIVGGLLLAVVGFADDKYGLSSWHRLLVQCLCTAVSVVVLFFEVAVLDSSLMFLWLFLVALVSVWWINLFNFLDGIDGYAISEAVFISLAAAGLCYRADAETSVQLFLMLAASLVGFAIINWPPARLFMGDAGSYFLGFIIAMLAILTVRDQLISPLSWLVLTALFWIDASYTLASRILNGERWAQAHRSHAYQILSRRWGSHQRVTSAAILVNVIWLFPLTYGCQLLLDNQQIIAAFLLSTLALTPIIWAVFRVKSGISID